MQISKLFDTSDFPARWHCGNWSAAHGWTHIVADISTAAAYFAIPALLVYFISKRRDFPFYRLIWLFCGFIVACGTVHLIEASIFWHPWYRVSATAKVITAIVSWATVIALVPIIPKALSLPGLAAMNKQLSSQVEERKRAEAELLDRNEMLNHFSRMASHDLKAPLRAIEHLLEWAIEDAGEDLPESSAEHIEDARSSAARLRASIENLLEFARVSESRHEYEPVDLHELVAEISDLLQIHDSVTVECSPDLDLRCWKTPLRQVLYNLIVNASIHGCDEELSVRVKATRRGSDFVITVTDSGPGVPAEERNRIFGVGKVMGAGIGDDLGGSGVGLAIVERLVINWGGEVDCVDAPGEDGACFRFTIPEQAADSSPPSLTPVTNSESVAVS